MVLTVAMQRTPLLLTRLIDRGARVAPTTEIVTTTSTGMHRQTLEETRARAHQLAHALSDAGIRIGDRVATLMWNGYRHLEVYHAVAGMGAVLHTLNVRLTDRELAYIVNHAGGKVLVTDADLLPAVERLAGRIPCIEKVVVCAEAGQPWTSSIAHAVDYEDFLAGHPSHFHWPELDEHAPLGLCYTSGTTGDPKGVEYEHRSQYLHTMAICMTDAMGLSATDTILGIVPMFHVMGWGIPWAALMLGCKQVLPHRFMDTATILRLIADEGVTLSAGVPTIWQNIRSAVESDPDAHDLSSLSRVLCGGAAPSLSLIRWYWQALGVEMIQEWGMTEISPLATFSRRRMKHAHAPASDAEQFDHVAKAGLSLPGLELDIFDAEFRRLPHDGHAVGDILIRGPWVCAEYYRNPSRAAFHGDWLITGDVGRIDTDEYLIVSDRTKDLIKSGGEWISSLDLENHMIGLDGVAQACVVAQPHPKWGERPVALVVVETGAHVTDEEIRAHCAAAFAAWQVPDDVLCVGSIPLTSTGKMDKKAVRAELESRGYLLPDLRESA